MLAYDEGDQMSSTLNDRYKYEQHLRCLEGLKDMWDSRVGDHVTCRPPAILKFQTATPLPVLCRIGLALKMDLDLRDWFRIPVHANYVGIDRCVRGR